jgi:probable F420-dependent oxidoreductase
MNGEPRTSGEPRPFRFGVLAGQARDPAGWRHTARRAEELGYSALLVPDHLDQQWGPLVSLAVAAEQTQRIALGTLMLAADLRRPAVLFKELATIAQLAPGRLEIGLGAGWLAGDFAAAAVELDPAATRIDRLEEAVQILKGLWERRRLTFHGQHYQVTDAAGEPRPADPAVKWVLGGGGRRVLQVAARHADIVSLSARMSSGRKDSSFGATATAEQFDRKVGWVRCFAGDRLAGIELQCLILAAAVVPNRERYATRVLSPMFGLPAARAMESPLALAGTVHQICADLRARRERFGISYCVIPGAQMEPFAEVVAELDGS